MSKNVLLNHLEFKTQKLALDYFRNILNLTREGDSVAPEYYEDVLALLYNHPRKDEKIGSGIKNIIVDKDDYNSRCFHLIRTDGSKIDFSYKTSITGDPNDFTKFSKACRLSIEDDIYNFKLKMFTEESIGNNQVKCAISGESIKWDESHVDHKPPKTFSVIVDSFIHANSLDISSIEYETEELYGKKFKDNSLAINFRSWHNKMAVLRITKAGTNLARAFMGRIKPTKADRTL